VRRDMKRVCQFVVFTLAVLFCAGSYAQQSNTIVLWAADVPPSDIHGDFTRVADGSAAGGFALANPDRARAKIAPPLAAPVNYIELAFTATEDVPYHLWLRLKAENNSAANDSVHVQFSDSVTAAGAPTTRIGSTSSLEVVLQDGSGGAVPRGWGWADNGWGAPGAPIYFATTGTHVLRIQQREDGPSVDQIVISGDTYATVPPGSRRDDTVTLAATETLSAAAVSSPGTIVLRTADASRTFGNWQRITDTTAAGGAALRNPDLGASKVAPALANPGTYFELTFSARAATPYHVWLRARADKDSAANDSVHVQFSDAVTASGSRVASIGTTASAEFVLQSGPNGASPRGWGWMDNGWGALGSHIYFAAAGTHTLRVQQREDGVTIDQIVISPDAYLTAAPGPRRDDNTILGTTVTPTNQPPAVTLTSPTSGTNFNAPATVSLAATASDPENRLARVEFYNGSTLLGADLTAPHTYSWLSVPAGTYTLTALAIDADGAQTRSSAVTVMVGTGTTSFPHQDIGAPAVAGSATASNGVYTITAGGADIWGSQDQFHLVYQQATGDLDVVARVTSLQNTNDWSKAGVMVREALTAGARHASTFVTPINGYAFQWRPDPGGGTLSSAAFAGAAPGWIRLVRTGNHFESFRSTDGQSWTSNGSADIVMPTAVYVGLAVTSHDAARPVSATIGQFAVSGPSTANRPPTISLTAPTNAATFTAPATIAIAANASDPENRLARVEFYNGSTRLGTDTTPPYTFSWPSVAAGAYSLTAIAYDLDGAQTRSAAVPVTVVNGGTTRTWTVAFTASADHDTNVTSYRFDVFAGGANPSSATPMTTTSLGKPTPDASREIRVDETAMIAALASGNYLATVTAVGPGGQTRSASYTFAR
jgi:hypothetical protein